MSQLLDQMRDRIRTLHYSIRTEDSYVLWAKQFILFHRKRHPLEMGEAEVGEFLTYLAVERNVAASTQNQALSAILFLYKVVLDRPLERVEDVLRAKKPQRLPVVFTREEVRAVLARMQGDKAVMASLLYGSGLRLMECLRLRVKDVDFGQNHIVVRDGKGQKDRVTVLPGSLVDALRRQVERVVEIHRQDLRDGFGRVYLPFALAKKYPNADREPGWQYLFPASSRAMDPRGGVERRHHQHEAVRTTRQPKPRRRPGFSAWLIFHRTHGPGTLASHQSPEREQPRGCIIRPEERSRFQKALPLVSRLTVGSSGRRTKERRKIGKSGTGIRREQES